MGEQLTGLYWLRVAHEIAVKLSGRTASSAGLTGAAFKKAYWLAVARSLSSFPCHVDLSTGIPGYKTQQVAMPQ